MKFKRQMKNNVYCRKKTTKRIANIEWPIDKAL